MNFSKKAQVVEGVGVAILIGLVIFIGGFSVNKIISENRYVGDMNVKIVYDLKHCAIGDIPLQQRISFGSLEEARSLGYNEANCKNGN